MWYRGAAQNFPPQKQHNNYSLHLVEFTNKIGTPYSVFRPQEYLSARALDRRAKMGILIDEYDLPINPSYIQKILAIGVDLQNKSKWLNAIAIHTQDNNKLRAIANLPFVKSVKILGKYRAVSKQADPKKRIKVETKRHTDNYYGEGLNQIRMLGGDAFHHLGYRGEGVQVAILDGGFKNVYRMPVFDSLRAEGRLLGTKDFVEGDAYVYESSTHGTNVLSCMGANSPYFLVGTAPDASYYLLKTEDVKGEFRTEELNWVAAVEYADSLGVDVINSSLGYTGFNDSTMSYSYEDMDGKTTYISRGARVGAAKGILIVNSAGNEGQGDWHYIGAPADVEGVWSIAAVNSNGKRVGFSSWGPTADGRIKPDIAAQGYATAVSSTYRYKISRISGTSFSSPVMAGMVASFKQAFPYKTAEEIKDVIKRGASQASEPDSSLGYGIPNYFVSYLMLSEACIVVDHTGAMFSTFSMIHNQLCVIVEQKKDSDIELLISDKLGQQKYSFKKKIKGGDIYEFKIPHLADWPADTYQLNIRMNGKSNYFYLIKY